MALHYDLPVYKACYDLLLEIFQFTKGFAKEYKYTVGESLKKETLELLTLIFRANSKTDKQATVVSTITCHPSEATESFSRVRCYHLTPTRAFRNSALFHLKKPPALQVVMS